MFNRADLKLMWMMVMFDLPTDTPEERKTAANFRSFLQKKGFTMAQFSVYFRFTGSREESVKYVSAVKRNAPKIGDICILFSFLCQRSWVPHPAPLCNLLLKLFS